MLENKPVFDLNKYAKKLNRRMQEEVSSEEMMIVLRNNLKQFESKTKIQITKKILTIHENNLKQLVSKAEYYETTNNELSYRSSQVAFQKENDFVAKLKTELEYLNQALNPNINKMFKKHSYPILPLSTEEKEILVKLTNNSKLFDFNSLKNCEKLETFDSLKMDVMIHLKKARLTLKKLKHIQEKRSLTKEEQQLQEDEIEIKRICNSYIEYIDSMAVHVHYEIKRQEKKDKKIIDEYMLSNQDKEKIRTFLFEEPELFTKEDLIFCLKYTLYKADILDLMVVLDKRINQLYEILDDEELNKVLHSIKDIIKFRKSNLIKDSLERNLLKDFEKKLKANVRKEKKQEEIKSEQFSLMFTRTLNDKSKINILTEEIRKNPEVIFHSYKNISYFEYVLSKYFNFILNHKKGLLQEEVINYQEEKNFYDKFLTVSLKSLKETDEVYSLKQLVEYYYNRFLKINEKNEYSLEQQKSVNNAFKDLFLIFNELPIIKNIDNKKIDLSNHYIMTIDDDKAKIREDAFSILEKEDTIEFVMYVMDMVHLYPLNQELEEKYLTNDSILNKGQKQNLSLNQGKLKNTIAYIFELKKDTLEPTSLKVQKEQIMVRKNYKFAELNSLIECKEETKNKDHAQNTLNFANKIKDVYFNQKGEINEASKVMETIILYFRDIYKKACEEKNYPILYKNLKEYMLKEDLENCYSSIRETLNGTPFITSPLREFPSYLNQLLSIWYFIQNRVESSKDIEKITEFIDHYARILNDLEKIKLEKEKKLLKLS